MQLNIDHGSDQLSVTIHDNPNAESLVLIIPAMGVPARYYERFADALKERGHTVAVMDLRGTGKSTPGPARDSRYGYAELADDIGVVLDNLATKRDGLRMFILGHSLGGQLALLHLARSARDDIDGLILIAAGMPYWKSYGSRRFQAQLLRTYVQIGLRIMGFWPGWGFGGPQSAGVMNDWAYTSRTGEFPRGLDAGLADLSIPTLVLQVEGDKHTPTAVVEQLVGSLTSSPLEHRTITTDLAGIPLDHFRWAKASAPVAEIILDWQHAH